ncbi:hemagglutinin repeat-containing protein [Gilliamella sp. ESL0250]|uniref:hemagglutinin repeat-containing protein n=1 Tax=Gilliamella sp. ESL0250 TaxID=2705036 RepID=UPI001EEBEE84
MSRDGQHITALSGQTDDKPEVSIDVSALGGMYAGKINLVGTEKGVGVHNAGELGASAGSITLTSDGKIVNTGAMQAQQDIRLSSQKAIVNEGSFLAKHDVVLKASAINSTKNSTVAAGIDEKGKLTEPGNIDATANSIAFNGKNSANNALSLKAKNRLNLDGSQTYANDLNLTGESISLSGAQVQTEQQLRLTSAKTINTSDATIKAKEGIALTTNALTSNNSQLIAENDITLRANHIKSNAAKINTNGAIIIDADDTEMHDASLSAKGAVSLSSSELNADNFDLITEQTLRINAKNLSTNRAKLQARNVVDINADTYFAHFLNLITTQPVSIKANQLKLDKSKISALGDITVQGRALSNRESIWWSGNNIDIKADNIENGASQMKAASSIHYQFDYLNNDNTVLVGGKHLTFTGNTLHNQQAKWQSGDNIVIDASTRFDNQSGLIVSGGTLTINTQAMANDDAKLIAHDTLDIHAKHLASDNSILQAGNALNLAIDEQINAKGVSLHADNQIVINSKKIDLSHAAIGAKGDISLTGQQQILNHGELLSTGQVHFNATTIEADDAVVKVANDLAIKAQESAAFNRVQLITNKKLIIEAPRANTANSTLYANDGMQLHFSQLNNQNANWFSGGVINLLATEFNNQKATIQAKQDLAIDAQQINNSEAILLTDGKLSINANQIDNTAAQIQTKDDIHIKASDQLKNANTKLITDGNIEIDTDNLTNTDAKFLSHQHIAIRAAKFHNEKSLFFADGAINFISNIINNQDSEIKSKQGIDIQTESLVSDRAEYVTEGSLNLASKTASLNHATVASKGDINIHSEQTLSIQKALLVAQQNMQLKANTINSSESSINSLGDIDITGTQLTNKNAAIISNKNIKIKADTINNTASEMGAQGHINVNAITLINSNAKWVANNGITIESDELNNSGAQLGSDKSLHINTKQFNNQKAIFNTKGDIAIQAESLDNTQSKLFSGQSIKIDTTRLINKGGVHKADNAIAINNQEFDNSEAILVAQSAINIISNTLNNTQATLQSQDKITLQVNRLDNQSALLLSGDKGISIDSQTLNNQQAKLFTNGDLTLHADNIANQHAKLVAEKSLNIKTQQIDNQQSELLAKGNINIHANTLNNQQVSLISENNIGLSAILGIDNHAAQLTANGKIELTSLNYINNNEAKLLSNNGIKLQTTDLNNQSASLKTNGLINVEATDVDNRQSEYIANNILLESHHLNNEQATLTANNTMVINAWDFNNSKGHLLADNIYLKTRAFQGDGIIKTKNDLSLDLDDSFINENEITANGHLSIRTTKDIINKNKITAGRQVSLSSQQLVNEQQAEISADYLALKHKNITNYGLIDGTTSVIRTDALNNLQTGRIYADNLAISATQLNNRGQNGRAPVIAARQNFNLGIKTLNNYTHAQLLSLGYFNIGGDLDENFNVIGLADVINNHSATIESQGSLVIAANTINNINDHIVTEMRQSDEPPEKETYFQTSEGDGPTKYSPNDVLYRIHTKYMRGIPCQYSTSHHRCYYKWNDIPEHLRHSNRLQRMSVPSHNIDGAEDSWEFNVIKQKYRTVVLETDPGKIMAADHIIIQGQTLNNQDSKIVAGKTVSINVNQLNNTSQETLSKYVYSGNYYEHKKKHKDDYRCYGPSNYTKADEVFIDDALNHNILDHQIFERTPLKETPKQAVEVENPHNQVLVGKMVGNPISQHEKQLTNPIIDLSPDNKLTSDKTNLVAEPKHKQDVIATLPFLPDNHFEGNLDNKKDTSTVKEPDLPATKDEMTPSKTISIYEPNLTLPDNSLWIVHKDTDKNYIIETDPRFTQRKKWLSSDYMLQRLKTDPDSIQKRLGDGYYEQQLIREQILGLTGNRYLHGYHSDLEQYQALMDAGIRFANDYGIVPGVELSAEQMKALTTDIVLLVKKTINVDGQSMEVLVPQVYVVNRPQLGSDGALIAGENVFIKGDELNSNGLINAKNDILLEGHNVTNKGTIYGDRVAINAKNDITNYGKLVGDKLVYLSADNDINLLSSTRTQTRDRNLTTNIDQSSIIQVNNGNIVIDAGRDINTKAGWIINNGETGNTWLQAGHDIKFNTADIEEKLDFRVKKDYRKTDEKSVVGTEISAINNVMLIAGNDINAKTVDIVAGNHLGLHADNDISIGASEERFELDEFHKRKKKGFLNKSTTTTRTQIDNTTQKGSELYGDSVTIDAGNNLTVIGSQVIGTHDVALEAGKAINIDAAEESYYRKHETKTKKSGLMGSGGIGFTVGKEKENLKQTDTEQAFVGSVVGSTNGNVNIQAGKDLNIKGSDVIAQRDIRMQGENVNIEALDAKTTYKEEYSYEKSGLTVALTGTAADMYEAAKAVERAKKKGNDKLLALQSIKSALTAIEALEDSQLKNQQGQSQASIGVSAMVGTQRTEREVNQEQHSVISSGVSAGRNIDIIATGDANKQGGDITLKGSEVKAGNDINLTANRDLNVIGAVNTQHSDSDEKSYGGGVGIQLQFGGDESGLRFKGNANFSRERENANGSAWTESVIDANNKLTIKTGNDVNIIGGQVKGDSVKMDVGHNLNIQSLQDTDDYDYEKISASVSGSGGFGGFSANGSLSSTNIDSKWASVTDQSGIFAGSGGYDITVGNNTDLKGAVIASEAKDTSKNKLDTGTISFSDIKNKADFKVSHVSVSGGTGGAGAPTAYQNSEKESSITHSAVENGQLIIRNKDKQKQDINELSRDTEHANNSLKPIFNKQKELDKLESVELVKDIAQQAKGVVNKYDRLQAQKDVDKNKEALSKKEAEKAYNQLSAEEQARIDFNKYYEDNKDYWYSEAVDSQLQANQATKNLGTMGGDVSKGIDTATSIITGIITGDITGGLAGASAPWIAEQIKLHTGHMDKDGNWVSDNETARLVSHAILGAVVAELQGNSGLAGGAGAVGGELASKVILDNLYGGKDIKDLTEAEKQNISALTQLVMGLSTAVSGGDAGDISTSIAASKNSVENNFMALQVMDEFDRDYRDGLLLFNGDKKAATDYANEMIRDRAIASGTTLAPVVIALLPEEAMIGGFLSGTANIGGQYYFNEDGSISWRDVGIATGTGAFTAGFGTKFWGTISWNAAGGALSNQLDGKDPVTGAIIGAGSSTIGYGLGKYAEKGLRPIFNTAANKYIHEANKGFLGITGHYTESSIPTWTGSGISSSSSEYLNKKTTEIIKNNRDKNE